MNHYIIIFVKFKMHSVQSSMGFIMGITFLNFLVDFFMQIMKCDVNADANSDTLECCVIRIRSICFLGL